MHKSRTFLTAVALSAAFSLAACTGGSGASSSSNSSAANAGVGEI